MQNHPSPIDDAKRLESDAVVKLNSFQLFYRKDRNITAADMFKRAANMYKISSRYKEFIRCMATASKIYEENDDLIQAASCYLDGARVAKLTHDEIGIELYMKHLKLTDNGHHGEIHKEIGEFYKELGRYDDAITYLTYAINEFDVRNRSYSINTCLDNICRIYINTDRFKDAGETLLKMSSKIKISSDNLIFTAILCFIVYDPVYAKQVLVEKKEQLRDDDIGFLDVCIRSVMIKDVKTLSETIDGFRFKFKVKEEHMNVVKHLKMCLTDDTKNVNNDDDIDLT